MAQTPALPISVNILVSSVPRRAVSIFAPRIHSSAQVVLGYSDKRQCPLSQLPSLLPTHDENFWINNADGRNKQAVKSTQLRQSVPLGINLEVFILQKFYEREYFIDVVIRSSNFMSKHKWAFKVCGGKNCWSNQIQVITDTTNFHTRSCFILYTIICDYIINDYVI